MHQLALGAREIMVTTYAAFSVRCARIARADPNPNTWHVFVFEAPTCPPPLALCVLRVDVPLHSSRTHASEWIALIDGVSRAPRPLREGTVKQWHAWGTHNFNSQAAPRIIVLITRASQLRLLYAWPCTSVDALITRACRRHCDLYAYAL